MQYCTHTKILIIAITSQGLFSPCDVIDVAIDAGSASAVHSIAFNPSDSNGSLFAAGDANGNVLIYRLPVDLTLSDTLADEEAVAKIAGVE